MSYFASCFSCWFVNYYYVFFISIIFMNFCCSFHTQNSKMLTFSSRTLCCVQERMENSLQISDSWAGLPGSKLPTDKRILQSSCSTSQDWESAWVLQQSSCRELQFKVRLTFHLLMWTSLRDQQSFESFWIFVLRVSRCTDGGCPAAAAGEGRVRVRWQRLGPDLPAASPSQALQHGLHTFPDEQLSLQVDLPCRATANAGTSAWTDIQKHGIQLCVFKWFVMRQTLVLLLEIRISSKQKCCSMYLSFWLLAWFCVLFKEDDSNISRSLPVLWDAL